MSRPRLTYANVMVTLLAFVVLFGGGAYAASKLGEGSVGTRQLKDDAVNSAKVENRALKKKDFARGVLAAGAAGFQANGSVNYDTFSSSLYGSEVVNLSVPRGSYFVTASVQAQTVNLVASNVQCRLINGAGGAATAAVSRSQVVRADTEPENFTLTGLFQVADGQDLRLQCSKSEAGSSARINQANVVALRIGAITGNAG